MKAVRGKWHHYESKNRFDWKKLFSRIAITIFVAVWFLAVIKVFLLEDNGLNVKIIKSPIANDAMSIVESDSQSKSQTKRRNENYKARDMNHIIAIGHSKHPNVSIPSLNEWDIIRASQLNQIDFAKSSVVDSVTKLDHVRVKKSSDLKWPPVLQDGSIPEEDGYDIMPVTKLKVPRFWTVPENQDVYKIGSLVNNEETIFLMIASYRDFQCRETITSAFNKADHPERLFVAAVDQIVPGDIGCLDIEVPCSQNQNQPICKYRDQISIFKMDAHFATGPVTARHIGDRMYRGEYFVMQMDAHCLFVRHWDTSIIKQWKMTGNEMAVLR
jgi:hypothetical protein